MMNWFNTHGADFFQYMLAASIRGGIFVLLIAVFSRVFRRTSARFQNALWLIALLQFLIPPRLYLPIPQLQLVSAEVASITLLPLLEAAPIESAPSMTWQGVVFQLWLIGVGIFLLISLVRRVALQQILKNAKPVARSTETAAAGSIPVRYHAQIPRAFAYGFFQPGIFLPEDAGQWSNAEYNFILQHEMAHIRRRDPLLLPLQNIIQCLFFFHPMVWLANHMINFYRELICDSIAIRQTGGRASQYSKTLLNHLTRANKVQLAFFPSSAFGVHKSFFIMRLKYLLNRKETEMLKFTWWQKTLVLMLLMLAVSLAVGEKQQQWDTAPEPVDGYTALMKWVKYPKSALKAGISGQCLVETTISKTGKVVATEIKKSLTPECDSIAVKAINSVGWKPAEADGKPVKATVIIPIEFKLAPPKPVKKEVKSVPPVKVKKVVQTPVEKEVIKKAKSAEVAPPPPPEKGEMLIPKDVTPPKDVPPPPPPAKAEFVAWDSPPEPIGGYAELQRNVYYPEIARKAGVSGKVMIKTLISTDGTAEKCEVVRSIGNNGTAEAAIHGIQKTKWKPAEKDGKPVAAWVTIPVMFGLDKKESSKNAETEDAPPPAKKAGKEAASVEWDKAPFPVGGFAALQRNLKFSAVTAPDGGGRVVLKVFITAEGKAEKSEVLRSFGDLNAEQAAMDAVQKTRWQPAIKDDKPVSAWVAIPIMFKL